MRNTDQINSRPRGCVLTIACALATTLLVSLGGCNSQIPQAIREAPANSVEVAQVQQQPARYTGERVRWGGTIIAVTNQPETTEVEVLARRLDADGAPLTGDPGQGRFIAQVAGFLDPAEYEKERSLAVVGSLAGVQTRPVGEYPYAYPVVRVESRYLWPKGPPPGAYDLGYGYPGWYDPWGPWFGPWFGPWVGPGWGGYGPYRGHGPGSWGGPGPGPGRGHWRH